MNHDATGRPMRDVAPLQRKIRCFGAAVLLLSLFLLFPTCPAAAQNAETQPPDSATPLVFGVVNIHYPPFFVFRGDRVSGLCIERLERALALLGLHAEYRPLPWNRILDLARSGEIDGVAGALLNSERNEFLEYVPVPLARQFDRFFTRKGQNLSWDGTLESLAGVPISTVLGYSYGQEFDSASFLDKHPSINDARMVRMVLEGRYPLGLGPASVVRTYARTLNMEDQLVFLEPPVAENPLFLALSRKAGHAALLPDLVQALHKTSGGWAAKLPEAP